MSERDYIKDEIRKIAVLDEDEYDEERLDEFSKCREDILNVKRFETFETLLISCGVVLWCLYTKPASLSNSPNRPVAKQGPPGPKGL